MKALITGSQGQDGFYLSELLLSKGYEVHGTGRGIFGDEASNYVAGVSYHVADMRDQVAIENVIRKVWPDEIYNLAAQVFVPTSWSVPAETFDVNVGGLARILHFVDTFKKDTKVYQASSSEMFGNQSGALDEDSAMKPVSPYGVSKLAAHELAHVYRDKGLFVVCGILFNHESPKRGEHMVTRKITKALAKWAVHDCAVTLRLGNASSTRDWGHARDYVEAMHLMMQQNLADDYAIGTGETHTVGEFAHECLKHCDASKDKLQIIFNAPEFTRQNELYHLKACALKAQIKLGWTPKTSFSELVKEMVYADMAKESILADLVNA